MRQRQLIDAALAIALSESLTVAALVTLLYLGLQQLGCGAAIRRGVGDAKRLDRHGDQPQQLPPFRAWAVEFHAQRAGRRL